MPSGANVLLLRPFDEGVLYGLQEMAEDRVVSNVQLYLDLVSQGGRGEEAATFLLEQRLRPTWRPSATTPRRPLRPAAGC